MRTNIWLQRFAWFTAGATFLLIISGGLVTSKGVGLAVPDWPNTFGYNMFLFPISKWVGGIFYEHTHRLIASAVGFLTIVLACWIWKTDPRRWVRWLGFGALAAVIMQGILGGLRVTMLKDEIGIFHACLAQAFLALTVFLALILSPGWNEWPRFYAPSQLAWLPFIATSLIYLQLGLGATMRHQHRDLSIVDFPTAYGDWWPETDPVSLDRINRWRDNASLTPVSRGQIWLQMSHRFLALIITGVVIAAALRVIRYAHEVRLLRSLAISWICLMAAQLFLGAWTIWSNKAADVSTAHVAGGAAMLSVGVALCTICVRLGTKEPLSMSIESIDQKVHAL